MNVELLTSVSSIADMERFAALAALTCHANADKEFVPSEVLGRIIKAGHESILEHINLTYSIKRISRALLQEIARHRHISLSVESTRHTLRKNVLANMEKELVLYAPKDFHYAKGACSVNGKECSTLGEFIVVLIRDIVSKHPDLSNDELKYLIPEFWPTNLVLTSNVRELRHILDLRTAPAALKEFRLLARAMYEAIPDEYKYLLKDCVHEEVEV